MATVKLCVSCTYGFTVRWKVESENREWKWKVSQVKMLNTFTDINFWWKKVYIYFANNAALSLQKWNNWRKEISLLYRNASGLKLFRKSHKTMRNEKVEVLSEKLLIISAIFWKTAVKWLFNKSELAFFAFGWTRSAHSHFPLPGFNVFQFSIRIFALDDVQRRLEFFGVRWVEVSTFRSRERCWRLNILGKEFYWLSVVALIIQEIRFPW